MPIARIIAIAAALAVTSLSAQAGRHGRLDPAFIDIDRVADRLDLTLEQTEQLHAIRDAHVRATIDARAELEWLRHELRRLIASDAPDRAAIDGKIDEIAELRGNMHKRSVNALLDGRVVLTLEQREQLQELRADRRAELGERREARRLRWQERRARTPAPATPPSAQD